MCSHSKSPVVAKGTFAAPFPYSGGIVNVALFNPKQPGGGSAPSQPRTHKGARTWQATIHLDGNWRPESSVRWQYFGRRNTDRSPANWGRRGRESVARTHRIEMAKGNEKYPLLLSVPGNCFGGSDGERRRNHNRSGSQCCRGI